MARPVPAQQHLVAGDLAGRDRLLHLVDKVEGVHFERMPEIVGHRTALARVLVHLALIVADTGLEFGLSPIKRQVGIAQEL